MKKITAVFLLCLMIFSCYSVVALADTVNIYVSVDGNDSGDGTSEKPLASLSGVFSKILLINAMGSVKNSEINVILRGGTYIFDSAVSINLQNSGYNGNTINIRAYDGESVVFTQSQPILSESFSKVTDSTVLSKVSESCRDMLYCADLSALGITQYGNPVFHSYGGNATSGFELYKGGETMTNARYPNTDYACTIGTVENGVTIEAEKAEKWKNAPHPIMSGFWKYDWADDSLNIQGFNAETGTVTFSDTPHFGFGDTSRYFIYNLIEELDTEDEYYLDRDSGKLYIIAPSGTDNLSFEYCNKTNRFLEIDSANNVKFSNIEFCNSIGGAASINGKTTAQSSNISFENCTFHNIVSDVIYSQKSVSTKIQGCKLYNIGNSGIITFDGTLSTLISSEFVVSDTEIYSYARYAPAYKAAISMYGVGALISKNTIHDGPHAAITFGGNDNIIENNEIYDVVKTTNDAGAIYCGRAWHLRGNVIRSNFLHDISIHGIGVYLDDTMCGVTVTDNIFSNVTLPVLLGGGRDNIIKNNFIIGETANSNYSIYADSRGTEPAFEAAVTESMNKLETSAYRTIKWKNKYPELYDILSDEPGYPKNNVIENNLIVNHSRLQAHKNVVKYGNVVNNTEVTADVTVSAVNGKPVISKSTFFDDYPWFDVINYRGTDFNPPQPSVALEKRAKILSDDFSASVLSDLMWYQKGKNCFNLTNETLEIESGSNIAGPIAGIFKYNDSPGFVVGEKYLDTLISSSYALEAEIRTDRYVTTDNLPIGGRSSEIKVSNGQYLFDISLEADGIYAQTLSGFQNMHERTGDSEFHTYTAVVNGEQATVSVDGEKLFDYTMPASNGNDDVFLGVTRGAEGSYYSYNPKMTVSNLCLDNTSSDYILSDYPAESDSCVYDKSGFVSKELSGMCCTRKRILEKENYDTQSSASADVSYLTYRIPVSGGITGFAFSTIYQDITMTKEVYLSENGTDFVKQDDLKKSIVFCSGGFREMIISNSPVISNARYIKLVLTIPPHTAVGIYRGAVLRSDIYYYSNNTDSELLPELSLSEITSSDFSDSNALDSWQPIGSGASVDNDMLLIDNSHKATRGRNGINKDLSDASCYLPDKIGNDYRIDFTAKVNTFIDNADINGWGNTMAIEAYNGESALKLSVENDGIYSDKGLIFPREGDTLSHTYSITVRNFDAELYIDNAYACNFTLSRTAQRDDIKIYGCSSVSENPSFSLEKITLYNLYDGFVIDDNCETLDKAYSYENMAISEYGTLYSKTLRMIPTSEYGSVIYKVPDGYTVDNCLFSVMGDTDENAVKIYLSHDVMNWQSIETVKSNLYMSGGSRQLINADNISENYKSVTGELPRYIKAELKGNTSLVKSAVIYKSENEVSVPKCTLENDTLTITAEKTSGNPILFAASYKDGRLVNVSGGNSLEASISTENCDEIAVYTWDGSATLKPIKKYKYKYN